MNSCSIKMSRSRFGGEGRGEGTRRSKSRKFITCVLGVGFLLLASFGMPRVVWPQDELDRTTGFFRRLGLDYLTIDELHAQLVRLGDSQESRSIATRLVEEYALQFLDGGPRHPDFAWDPAQMQRLIDSWPELSGPELRLAVLAARLQATDQDFQKWQNQLSGNESLAGITRELELVLRAIEGELDSIAVADQTSQSDNALLRFRGTMLLAHGSMRQVLLDAEGETASLAAVRALQQILRLDSDPQISSGQLDAMVPEYDWQIGALESLAICRLRTQTGDVGKVMAAIERAADPAGHLVSRIRVLAGSGSFEAIDRLLADYEQTPLSIPGMTGAVDSQVWFAALQAGRQTPSGLMETRRDIIWRAVGAFAMADERLLHQSLFDWTSDKIPQSPNKFTTCWIASARLLGEYLVQSQSGDTEQNNPFPRYLQPVANPDRDNPGEGPGAKLTLAQDQVNAGYALLDTTIRADYQAGFLLTASEIHFLLGDWQTAAVDASRVLAMPAGLRIGQPERAAVLLLQSRVQLAATDPSQQLLLQQDANDLAIRFPDHPVGGMAQLQSLIVENRQRPAEQGIAFWKKYLEQFPENETAQVELLTRLLEVAGDPDMGLQQETFSQALAIVRSLLNSKTDKSAAWTWAVSGLIQAARENRALMPAADAAVLLEQLERITANQETAIELRGEAAFATMQLAEMTGNDRARKRALAWTIGHPKSGPWYAAALLEQVRQLEPKWETADPGSTNFDLLLETYEAVFDDSGADSKSIERDPNVRLIAGRLADMYVRMGRNSMADKLFGLILQAYPNDRDVLLSAARMNMANGEFEKGTGRWQRLIQFFPPGSELWRESRYNLYQCLLNDSQEAAETVRRQTFELDPEMPGEWLDRYPRIRR